ncbi:MAG: hypothetical protein ACI89X_002342 [Planctomycetota bacterium]|jgi:hypothetical protein
MKNHRRWPRIALLAATLTLMTVLALAVLDLMGIGPNLGLSVGYYGRFNRIVARIQASPDIEVVRTTLHRDQQLEDFYITVRTQDEREVRLRFEEAHTRPFSELVQELKRVGL